MRFVYYHQMEIDTNWIVWSQLDDKINFSNYAAYSFLPPLNIRYIFWIIATLITLSLIQSFKTALG